ncbi:hypothetical protein P170DRAFT_416521 [Aspergillus steynii IBT 23096]|uniref:beta-glucosidase n=1 Tax=Aspergillus steynii IBT 23096 TaxID=1392250 RepID=A0A2I2FTZ5_9EURO|nr:uncharacterized protein P170DRAFT_416521 [Aspergillus steynii IBT 23096]PLB44118.1 hypothetical protein P170DRAFT_416521 [Aspergillus steynii IBT 23096]
MAPSKNVKELLDQLILEEKVSLVSGADGWQTHEIPRLGIGSLKTTDGPAGARGKLSVGGSKAIFLPAPVAQAATWSKTDVRAIGRVLMMEVQSKAAQIVLAPTMCCIRNPLGGRNFESFSEDPFLSGTLAIEYVAGVQETGTVAATAKHFVANEQEFERFTVNAQISEKALREIYLRPFEMLIKGPNPPGCIMTSYNSINGLHADMNSKIIQHTLRDEWQYKGLVMSDWGGTNSTAESLIAGCDLEMPGPSERRGSKLLEALEKDNSGKLEAALELSCERIISLLGTMNLLGLSESAAVESRYGEEKSSTASTDIQTVRDVVGNGLVLLKNSNNILPLSSEKVAGKRVAFIGPNGQVGAAGGGGSASMNPQYQSHPMEAFKQRAVELGVDIDVQYAIGCHNYRWLPLVSKSQWRVGGEDGVLRLDFFDAPGCAGRLIETQYRDNSQMDLFDTAPAMLQGSIRPYSFRMSSTVTPRTTGRHSFGVTSIGNSRLFINGALLIDNYDWTEPGEMFYSFGSAEVCHSIDMVANQTYEVILESSSKTTNDPSPEESSTNVFGIQPSVRLGFLEEVPDNLVSDALQLAKRSDFTVAVIGLNEEWESEGFDRQTMQLPGSQNELIQTLLTGMTQPSSLIIVNQSGSPVEMPWSDDAGTILQAWYGGQEAGNALADVLLGQKSPCGRLPMTWPRRYEDLPFSADAESWPGVNGQVCYKEDVEVGYRWYPSHRVKPQWWLGEGLSYTTFSMKGPAIILHEAGLTFHVEVVNDGRIAGQDVIQAYSWLLGRPEARQLVAFEKSSVLSPAESQTIRLQITFRDMAHWNESCWVLGKGAYMIGICENAGGAVRVSHEFTIDEDMKWIP